MGLMLACGVLLLGALLLTVRWRVTRLALPPWEGTDPPAVGWLVVRFASMLGIGAYAGLLAGLLVVGPGGRLAMRLLAATSPDATGRLTDADQVVGRITFDGTLGFFIFAGLPFGLACGLVYALAHRAFRTGPAGGALFGLMILVVVGAIVDPLRPENPDFELLGPGWLSILVFAALAAATGAFVAVAAGRIAAPIARARQRGPLLLAPAAVVTLPALVAVWPLGLVVVLGLVLYVGYGRSRWYGRPPHARAELVLRVGVSLVALAFLPSFCIAVADIA